MEDLNPAQRRAAGHGLGNGAAGAATCDTPPLLIIAGAGSGKTNTLAHRVAFLIRQGVAAERILLLTFTRRAAAEMKRRVERICARARDQSGAPTALAWSGTFHSVGARLLRLHAHNIGLDPAFTILDREDGADLLNLLRDELGLSGQKSRFPKKQTCLAIYSYAMNAQAPLGEVLLRELPLVRELGGGAAPAVRRLCRRPSSARACSTTTICCSTGPQMMGAPRAGAAGRPSASTMCWWTNTRTPMRCRPRSCWASGPRAGASPSWATMPRRSTASAPRRCATSWTSPDCSARRREIVTLEQNYRSTQPILAASNAVIEQARERFTKSLFSERASQQQPRLVTVHDDRAQAGYVVGPRAGGARSRHRPQAAGGAVPRLPSQRCAWSWSWRGATSPSSNSAD